MLWRDERYCIRLAFSALLFLGTYSFATNDSFTGIVSDSMCVRKMMPDKPDSDCVRACAKAGAKEVLLVGAKVYKLEGAADQVNKFAGQKVKVTGDLAGNSIRALKVGPAH